MINFLRIQIFFGLFCVIFCQTTLKSYFDFKNQQSQNKLDTFPGGLNMDEACVICQFVIQKVDQNIDTSRDCPELAESQFAKAQEIQDPDPYFNDKWRLFQTLKGKQDEERRKPFAHEDDSYYYIVHPDHINNFISGNNNNNAPYYGGNGNGNGGAATMSGDDSKTIIYHDKDGLGNYPSELLVRNQVSASNQDSKPPLQYETPIRHTTTDIPQFKEQVPTTVPIDVNRPFLKQSERIGGFQGVTDNGLSDITNIWRRNAATLQNIVKRRDNATQANTNRFIENQNNTVPQQGLQSPQQYQNPIVNQQPEQSRLKLLDGDMFPKLRFKQDQETVEQERFNEIPGQGQTVVAGLQTEYPPEYKDVSYQPNLHPDYLDLKAQVGPYKVNQAKLDRTFKDRDQFQRYNKAPLKELNLEPHEVNPDFPGPGSFIIDKNINHDKIEPSSMLFPEYKDIQLNNMHFVKGHVKDPDGLAQKQAERYPKPSFIQSQEKDSKQSPSTEKGCKTQPFKLDQSKIDRVFQDKEELIRYNQGPRDLTTISPGPKNPQFPGPGMFILDKNINHDQTVPTSLLFPGADEELPNDVYVFPSFIQQKHKSKLISKKMSMFFQNKLKSKLKVFPEEPLFEDKTNALQKLFERPYHRVKYPMVNTDANLYDIMNTGQRYIGYGKALFPPHPEDLFGAGNCCQMAPCLTKPPCEQSTPAPPKKKPCIPKRNYTDEAAKRWFNFKEDGQIKRTKLADETWDGNTDHVQKKPRILHTLNSMFLQTQLKSHLKKKSHMHHKAKINSEITYQLNEKTGETENLSTDSKQSIPIPLYNSETGRRQRRIAEFPDPGWDCMNKNIATLTHFICEQEVALSYTRYCKPIIAQKDIAVESFLYHDSVIQICQNLHMCPFK